MQNVDQNKMKWRRRHWIEAHFEKIVVVGCNAKARYKTVNHKIVVLINIVCSTRERLWRIEKQWLKYKTEQSAEQKFQSIRHRWMLLLYTESSQHHTKTSNNRFTKTYMWSWKHKIMGTSTQHHIFKVNIQGLQWKERQASAVIYLLHLNCDSTAQMNQTWL